VKSTFIAWTLNSRRSDLLAEHLGASMHHIYCGHRRGAITAPARYVLQARETWQTLLDERPDVVFVQNPPIFCALVASAYAQSTKARFVIDSHTGAFLSPRWRWALPLHRSLSRKAVTTIVTNKPLQDLVRSWSANAFVLAFTPGRYPLGTSYPLSRSFNVAAVTTFDEDEPVDILFAAARRLKDVTFYLTGDPSRLPPSLRSQKPANCQLTGYLPFESYIGLLRGANAVLDLTKHDQTLLMGGFEAVSVGTPLIVSDWPVLREYFSAGTVHVENSVESICAGILRAQREQANLRQGILSLQKRLEAEWESKIAELKRIVGGP